jgi:hypothetical protein
MEPFHAPDIFTLTANVTAPGAPITDALPMTIDGDMQVFVRQLEVQLAQVQELTTKADEHRSKLAKSLNEKSLAVTDLQVAREGVERLQQDLEKLEEAQVDLPRRKNVVPWGELVGKRQPKGLSEMKEETADEDKAILEKLRSIRVTVEMQNAPMTAIVDHLREVTGLNIVAPPSNIPDGEVVTVKVKDAALDQTLRQLLEPRGKTYRVHDGVIVILPSSGPEAMAACVAPLTLEVAGVSEDGTRLQLKGQLVSSGRICAVTRAGKFMALILVDGIAGDQPEAKVLRDLAVGRILPGDRVQVVTDPRGYLAALPIDVRKDLSSRASQQAIRAKMGLKE